MYRVLIEPGELSGLYGEEELMPIALSAFQWLIARMPVEESEVLRGVKFEITSITGKFPGNTYPVLAAIFNDPSRAKEIEECIYQEISLLLDQRSVRDFLYYIDATGARRFPRTMTLADLSLIEGTLGIRLPDSYRKAVTAIESILPREMFTDARTIIGTNLSYRRSSWLGRPLERVFFIFGRDDHGNALYMDLDLAEPVVFSADHKHRCGRIEARSFHDWFHTPREGNGR